MPVIVLVGGYLGAGKTTLILKAAELLEQRGLRTGLVMNDQGGDLVDTDLARLAGREVRDVTSSCFCCDYPSLVGSLESLAAAGAEVILAEPVGSCTDIIRTVVHPLQEMNAAWTVAPFTVLVDPQHIEVDPGLQYLWETQLAEADLLIASKSDIGGDCPIPVAGSLSAKTGEGVAAWLELVLGSSIPVGAKSVDVDYARYGAAEASLAWLNWTARATCSRPISALELVGPFVEDIRSRLRESGHAIAHLKALSTGAGGYLRIGLCHAGAEFSMEGAVIGDLEFTHRLILNLRARCAPESVLEALSFAIARLEPIVQLKVVREQCFSPEMPSPSIGLPAS